jgi:uncharacterized protein (TIGR02145 family)
MKNTLLLISLITYVAINAQVTDVNGKTYNTATIGTQIWMSENLDVDKFRNGSPISQARSQSEWDLAIKNKRPAWCYYQFNSINSKMGKVYNSFAVSDLRGLAPNGYHIPSSDEWYKISDLLNYNPARSYFIQNGFILNFGRFNLTPYENKYYGPWWRNDNTDPVNYTSENEGKGMIMSFCLGCGIESGYPIRCIKD